MTETIVTQETPIIPTAELSETAILWARGGNAALTEHLVKTAPLTCPACESPCGALINGVCLGCDLEWDDAITQAEARYDACAESCCTCGID